MSQDAQILTDNPDCLQDNYVDFNQQQILESATPDLSQEASAKKPTLKWAHPRFILSSFQLYETKTVSSTLFCYHLTNKQHILTHTLFFLYLQRYYVVGTNQAKQRYRVLQIDRTNPNELTVIEDDVLYTEQEKTKLLKMIEDGNLSVGGLQLSTMEIYGVIGFIRFTQGWYIIFITKRRQVAVLGGHYIYHIDKTRLVPIGPQVKLDKNSDEARYITTFQNIDLAKNFYFSYTYDLTNSLQNNLTQPPLDVSGTKKTQGLQLNDMFVWNHYLLSSGFKNLNSKSGWILPLIYGFVDQASKFRMCIYVYSLIYYRNICIWEKYTGHIDR